MTPAMEREVARTIECVVWRIAARWPGIDRGDLLGEGWIVAMRAVRYWAPEGGASLRTYLWGALSMELPRAVARMRSIVHVPRGRLFEIVPERAPFVAELADESESVEERLDRERWLRRARLAFSRLPPEPANDSTGRAKTARFRWRARAARRPTIRNLATEIGIEVNHGRSAAIV